MIDISSNYKEQKILLHPISKDKNFLKWIYYEIKNGYQPFITLEELDEFVDKIILFYQNEYNFKNPQTINKLINNLTNKETNLLNCYYRNLNIDNSKKLPERIIFLLKIKDNSNVSDINWFSNEITLTANIKTGIIDMYSASILDIKFQNPTITQLLSYLNLHKNKFDFEQLHSIINNNNLDKSLRYKIMEFIIFKISYLENKNQEFDNIKLKSFIETLISSTKELDFNIDDIVKNYYHNSTKINRFSEFYVKKYIKKNID